MGGSRAHGAPDGPGRKNTTHRSDALLSKQRLKQTEQHAPRPRPLISGTFHYHNKSHTRKSRVVAALPQDVGQIPTSPISRTCEPVGEGGGGARCGGGGRRGLEWRGRGVRGQGVRRGQGWGVRVEWRGQGAGEGGWGSGRGGG